MRKLDRTKAQTPACLSKYSHNTHKWGDKPPETCKGFLWKQFHAFQDGLCACCETKFLVEIKQGILNTFSTKAISSINI